MDCDIVLLPSRDISEKAISASKALSKLGSLFVLQDGTCYPHMSLYILRFKPDDMARITGALQSIADKTYAFKLHATDYLISHKYVVTNFAKTPELITLQNILLELLGPLRHGMPESERENMREAADSAVLRNFQRYGYKYVSEFFVPHVTLTRFIEEHRPEDVSLPNPDTFDGVFASIGLFELGLHSTCVRKLAEFPLLSV